MISIIYAHPYPSHSRTNRSLLNAIGNLPEVKVRSLYELYPDSHIDVRAEQAALAAARTIVLQHPLYWYHTPALLSLWFEKVLTYGLAFGKGDRVLQGKRLLWAPSTGAAAATYDKNGYNNFSIEQISTPIRQTALFCGFEWLPPFITHDAGQVDPKTLLNIGEAYRDRLVSELNRPEPAAGDERKESEHA